MTNQITLHWLEQSRSQRIAWLLEELKLDYNLKIYKRVTETYRAEKSLTEIHQLGKSPVLEIDGKIICESALIVDYLIKNYGKDSELNARSEDEEFDTKFFIYHCEGSLQPDLTLLFVSQRVREKAPYLLRSVASKVADGQDEGYADPDLKEQLKFLESKLKENGSGFFVGNHLSAADILYLFPLLHADGAGYVKPKQHDNLLKWINIVKERPAYKRAIERVKKENSTVKIF